MPSVVSVILKNNDEILLLKRSNQVRTYRGKWGVVAGYVEPSEAPRKTAVKEIREEVGLQSNEIILQEQLEPVVLTDTSEGEKYEWVIHPFVFIVKNRDKIRIDWEHVEFRWIKPKDIDTYETTPGLKEIVKKAVK
ncbi:MAG: NUDIX domain-containing protein [Candidatus Thermoplasmatota archaeon]